jgi:glycosyltransferase involved in cell wall biosynthesis
MRVLIASNMDSSQPFGQFTRPFHLGAGLSEGGVTVACVGIDCSAVHYGESWSVRRKSLRSLARACSVARREFQPDVVYGHEMRGAMAAMLGARGVPLVVDFHSVPSVEWAGYARDAPASEALRFRLAGLRSAAAERTVTSRARQVIAAGAEVAEEVSRRYSPVRPPAVVGNGVARQILEHPIAATGPYGPGIHAMTTIPGAQSVSNARALEFLGAAARALDVGQEPSVTVHVIGSAEGPSAGSLVYEGFQEELLPWIGHADVCLLPYPDDAALCGGARNKLLEYVARGRTLVTTREGLRGLPEAAQWEGVTVTEDDPAAFAAAIRKAASANAPTLDEVRAQIHDRLRWDRLALEAKEVLQSAAGGT